MSTAVMSHLNGNITKKSSRSDEQKLRLPNALVLPGMPKKEGFTSDDSNNQDISIPEFMSGLNEE